MISVNEYLEKKDLLAMYYTPYQQKCAIVDTIIDQIKIGDKDAWYIDYAQLNAIKNSIFVGQITNIDMTSENEEGLFAYDVLLSHQEWQPLLEAIRYEYDLFEEVLELKLQTLREYFR